MLQPSRLDWLDALKGLALLGILFNHLVEEFEPGPLIHFLGVLGDGAPGVFILASGVGLALAAARRDTPDPAGFYRRRLRRLFPLYIACHFVILGAAALIPAALPAFGDARTLFSLTGVRTTAETFFWISPSWWFVWTVLQLYIAFPLLCWSLRRHGAVKFLAGCVLLTFAIRAAGFAGVPDLYFWMTGIFAGTRLAEFAVGMAIGAALARDPDLLAGQAGRGIRMIPAGLLLWGAGIASTLAPAGAIVFHLLVTLGMSATAFGVWQLVKESRVPALVVLWVGNVSFAVFLLHQPPLQWTALGWPGDTLPHLAAALLVLALSFPAAVMIERLVGWLETLPSRIPGTTITRAAWCASVLVITGTAVGFAVPVGGRGERAYQWVIAAGLAVLVLTASRSPGRVLTPVRLWALAAGAIGLFLLPLKLAPIAVVCGTVYAATSRIFMQLAWPRSLRAVAAGGITILVLLVTESVLARTAPLETGGWGERPALEIHPTRGYALKPSRTTRLRYRHSDYIVTTNSLGLASPEISVKREDPSTWRLLVVGDAFAMPEGLPYEASFPALLQESLERCMAPRPVEVINGGVTGYGPVEELAQMRELVPQLQPDIVIHEFFVNEWQEIDVTAGERRRGIGLTGPRESPLERWLRRSQLSAQMRRLTGQLREPYWETRWGLLQFYTDEERFYSPADISAMRDTLARMAGVARSGGARYMIFHVPAAVTVSPLDSLAYVPEDFRLADVPSFDRLLPSRALRQATAGLNIDVIELGPALRKHPRQPVYDRWAWYWNREGHRVAATEMLRALAEAGEIPQGCAGW